jgi:hypothetical protein
VCWLQAVHLELDSSTDCNSKIRECREVVPSTNGYESMLWCCMVRRVVCGARTHVTSNKGAVP